MDIKSLWQKFDQISEASDLKSIPEAKKKKPDADGDGVPDWADKKPGKDDNEDKEKVDESQLDELSPNTLGNYIKKSASDAIDRTADEVRYGGMDSKADQRVRGISKAVDRLSKSKNKQDVSEEQPQLKPLQKVWYKNARGNWLDGEVGRVHPDGRVSVLMQGGMQMIPASLLVTQDPLKEGEMSSRIGDKGETIRRHTAKAGGYGRKIDKDDESGDAFHSSDIDDIDDAPAASSDVKRGRGRPRIGANSDTGEVRKFDPKVASALQSFLGSTAPKKMDKIGKTSHVHKLKEYMEQVEAQMITEGKMSELDSIINDIESGDIDVYDIITGKYMPMSKIEEFVAKLIKNEYEERTRESSAGPDDAGPDVMDHIAGTIRDTIEKKLNSRDLEEVAIGGTGTQTAQQQPPAGQQAGQTGQQTPTGQTAQQQPAKVMAGGKVMGTAPTPQAATQATPIMTRMQNDQKQLAKLGVSQVQESRESLADTMNKFSAALDAPRKKRSLNESTLSKVELVMEGTLEEILQVYPHEHKMCQEGWGMDEAMFEALCDHYHRDGKIPRKVWHGSMDELRKHVEECYMQDTQQLMGESNDPEDYSTYNKSQMDALGAVSSSIQVHDTPASSTPASSAPSTAPATSAAPAPSTTTPSASTSDLGEDSDLVNSNHSKIMDLVRTYYKSMGSEFWDWFNEPGNKESFAKRIDVTPEEAYQVVDSMDWGQYKHDSEVDEGEIGSKIGSTAGEMLGAEAGPIGSAVGGAVGGMIGDKLGDKVGDMFGEGDDLLRELDEELDRVLNKENAMYESKKPSAGMTSKEKSAVAKKAQNGGDIGKPGKGFEKIAKKAAKTYGSAEAGKKVAAAAMWKNAAHQTHESADKHSLKEYSGMNEPVKLRKEPTLNLPKSSNAPAKSNTRSSEQQKSLSSDFSKTRGRNYMEASDEEQMAHDLSAHKRKLAREKNRAEITGMMSAEHPTKRSGEREQAKIRQTNRQLQKPEVVDEAKSRSSADNKAEKAGKKVTKDLEYDMKHKGKDDKKAERAGKKVTKDIEWDEKHKVNEGKFSTMDADLADMTPAEFKKEYGMTKAEARAKHGAKSDTKKLDEMDNPDWRDDIGKKEVMAKPITVKKMKKDAEKEMNKAFNKATPKKVKESYDFSLWDQQLTQLIEGKKPTQPQQIDESARSITKRQQINEAGLADLFAMLKNAGMSAQAPAEIEVDIESNPEQNTAAYRDGDSGVYDGTGSPAMTSQASGGDDPHMKFDDASDVPVMAMPRGMGMSQNTDGVESHVVEPVMSDEVIDHLQSGESDDTGDDTLAFIKKTMNHGETPIDVVQTSNAAGSGDYEVEVAEDNYGDTQQAGASATGSSPSPMANKPAQSMNVQEEEDEEVEEGNAFSGAVAKAKADGIQKGEKITVGGKEYPVKEQAAPVDPSGQGEVNPNNGDLAADEAGEAAQDNAAGAFDQAQAASQPKMNEEEDTSAHDSISSILKKLEKLGQMMSDHKKKDVKEGDDMNMVANRHSELELDESKQECNECGGMYEGEHHNCDENLTEWANTPSQLIDEETFETDIDFMTRGISGGLNNQKQDQTLVGSGPNRVVTQTERGDVNQSMGALLKKLSGIN